MKRWLEGDYRMLFEKKAKQQNLITEKNFFVIYRKVENLYDTKHIHFFFALVGLSISAA